MEKIVDYQTAVAQTQHGLDKEVKKLMKLGWQPLGGSSACTMRDLSVTLHRQYYQEYNQAMVKYKENQSLNESVEFSSGYHTIEDAVNAINLHLTQDISDNGSDKKSFLVGITDKIDKILSEYKIDRNNGVWITRLMEDCDTADNVMVALINMGYSRGDRFHSGDLDIKGIYVYAVKTEISPVPSNGAVHLPGSFEIDPEGFVKYEKVEEPVIKLRETIGDFMQLPTHCKVALAISIGYSNNYFNDNERLHESDIRFCKWVSENKKLFEFAEAVKNYKAKRTSI